MPAGQLLSPEARAAFALRGLDGQIKRVVDTFDGRATEEERAYSFLRFSVLTSVTVIAVIIIGEVFFP